MTKTTNYPDWLTISNTSTDQGYEASKMLEEILREISVDNKFGKFLISHLGQEVGEQTSNGLKDGLSREVDKLKEVYPFIQTGIATAAKSRLPEILETCLLGAKNFEDLQHAVEQHDVFKEKS